ncbi:uncharacterized protein MELLADRAFT_111995 [Melampsora larici-populina 98AG31]|uniref:Uncharacterized protein n=1 Tax=Melampsora larici-populina (strain 98AG31 / pathotype 3-4-7) TaxID=747676 RepID=F4S512_MELLP|nr:uncharacterized protein MELLADRAFT_111995 [Melampsora larici-populina 98AG31]EGG00236.1 hypothetical protein MELLADRAFT_111995 [Melampsora larici-populina 98AG31]
MLWPQALPPCLGKGEIVVSKALGGTLVNTARIKDGLQEALSVKGLVLLANKVFLATPQKDITDSLEAQFNDPPIYHTNKGHSANKFSKKLVFQYRDDESPDLDKDLIAKEIKHIKFKYKDNIKQSVDLFKACKAKPEK